MKRLTTLVVIALFVLSVSIFAQPVQKSATTPIFPGPGIINWLNLTNEQVQKFNDIISAQREAMIDSRAEIQKLRLEKQKIMLSANPDFNELKKINAKIIEIISKNSDRRVETWAKINEILTPEQQAIWKQSMFGKRPFFRRTRGCPRYRMWTRMQQTW